MKARNVISRLKKDIAQLRETVDTLIVVPNQRLLSLGGRNLSLLEAFKKADDILYQAVKGISDLILVPGLINLDFADVKSVMSNMGMAIMGTGVASGESGCRSCAESDFISSSGRQHYPGRARNSAQHHRRHRIWSYKLMKLHH